MCGRFTHLFTWKQLHRLMSLVSPEIELSQRFNVAPTQNAPVITSDQSLGGPALRLMRWGLVPSWAKDLAIGNSLINARAEGVDSKPSFRAAFKKRRCLVPISGFYEWQKVEGSKTKQPFYITPNASDDPWLLAGLWESWHDPALAKDAPPLETFTIITTDANQAMAPIHNRMPVILTLPDARHWINPDTPAQDLSPLLRPCPPQAMTFRKISTLVNSPRHDTPQCIQEVSDQDFGTIFSPKG